MVLWYIEDNFFGEIMIMVYVLVSLEYFDKLISHLKIEDVYKFYLVIGG